ncbi:MAG: hypothetical protein F6K54_13660 [Okeania sp. SIO3B5]|uniref:hypothetical protein n=1 Tax=Okeania sp. SIO3B5 TaxID=2607811 RepID=UPI001400FE55|nr:hypothetical protein [Okeania sp. SIO3B5]NEO54031.1 hypothetical protein [Okeania sp. SIO3B5]
MLQPISVNALIFNQQSNNYIKYCQYLISSQKNYTISKVCDRVGLFDRGSLKVKNPGGVGLRFRLTQPTVYKSFIS